MLSDLCLRHLPAGGITRIGNPSLSRWCHPPLYLLLPASSDFPVSLRRNEFNTMQVDVMPPMMFGFGSQRRRMLEGELQRFAEEMPQLGMTRLILIGDLVSGEPTKPDTTLELVVVQETDEPFHRRSDFWVTHLRPSVGTTFHVYTETEFFELADSDPLLIQAQQYGDSLH